MLLTWWCTSISGILTVNCRNDQLFAASGAKKTFGWLNKVGVTSSYHTPLKKTSNMSKVEGCTRKWTSGHEIKGIISKE